MTTDGYELVVGLHGMEGFESPLGTADTLDGAMDLVDPDRRLPWIQGGPDYIAARDPRVDRARFVARRRRTRPGAAPTAAESARIAELQRQLGELRRRYDITHALWRAGLRKAEAGADATEIEFALIGADEDRTGPEECAQRMIDAGLVVRNDRGRLGWATVRTVPGGGLR